METYWKSITNPVSGPSLRSPTPRALQSPLGVNSPTQNSPSIPMPQIGSHSLTHSSVIGSYLYIPIQVTRDLEPVVFPEWSIPEEGYDLGVADLTLAQFKGLAQRHGRTPPVPGSSSIQNFRAGIVQCMASLREVLQVSNRQHPFTRCLNETLHADRASNSRNLLGNCIPTCLNKAATFSSTST